MATASPSKARGGARSGARAPTRLITWLALSLFVILVDQLSKLLVLARFEHGDGVPITGWFNLVRVHNPGAAFSFLASADGWQRWFFVVLGVVASGFFLWLLRAHAQQKLFAFALAMLLGGAIGNVIDRLWLGYVVDFLQVHWDFLKPVFPGGYFPAFNVADSAITAGAIGLILDELRRVRNS
jgi:signal peptidase II